MSFSSLGLSAETLRAIQESGYTEPTPIQKEAIPVVLSGRDVIGIAQTGTGKTAGFTLPMIDTLAKGRAKARMPRSLILEPTRELAAQVSESFEKYGKYHKLSMALLIGGVSFDNQETKIDRGVDVLIATPGRLLDHFERGKLLLTQVQILVVDEADRMLDMGFIPDVERICKLLPFTRQTLFFSATMAPEIQRLTDQFLSNPVRIEVSKPATAATTIEQALVMTPSQDWAKREVLRHLMRTHTVSNGIIFCNRKTEVATLHKSLVKHGFSAGALHGDMSQPDRLKTLDAFRNGQIHYLVASDVAARGLDIPTVSHIFNFDVPVNAEDYVHRIGRTGRAGRIGHAFTLVAPIDKKRLAAIHKLTGKDITVFTPDDMTLSEERVPAEGEKREGRGGRRPSRDGAKTRGPRRGARAEEPVNAAAAIGPAVDTQGTDEPITAAINEDLTAMAAPAPKGERKPRARKDHPKAEHRAPSQRADSGREKSRPEKDRLEKDHREAAPRERSHDKDNRERDRDRRPRPNRRDRDDGHDDNKPVIGLGDHVPAFLLRPVPRRARPAPETLPAESPATDSGGQEAA